MAILKERKKKKSHSLHYCVLFKIDSLPKEICVLSSFSRDCCCIFFYPSCYIFYENRIKTTMSHLFGFCCAVLFCFSTLLDGSEQALTRNKTLSYLLFITHLIYKAHIYSSDTEGRHISHLVRMPHLLSITWVLIPLVKEQITYLKLRHLDSDSLAGEHLCSLIAAITLSALKTCTHMHTWAHTHTEKNL